MLEQDRTSEARRKAQRNGEEDPVIVAQRFLNIYRQLHIFSAEKKEAFNKMLLELPAEIRGLFSSLPGGAVLQDYVDELSEKAGLAKAVQPAAAISAEIADEEVSKAKILATALAEAQVQAAAKIQAAPAPQPAAAPIMAAAAAPAVATTAHLSMDKGFAQEFASVLAAAMQKNNAEQKDDIKNIINTLGQTQLEIVKVLQSENNERREDMMTISKMLSDSQAKIAEMGSASGQGTQTAAVPQPKISEETKQLIRMLLDSQQQIAGRLAKVEAAAQANNGNGQDFARYIEQAQANFAKALSSVNERQKNDTLEIAKLINDSQQKLVQMMIQHNTLNTNSGNAAANNNNANNIQINTADYAPQLNLIVDKLASIQTANNNNLEAMVDTIVKAQSQLYREVAQAQTKELSAIISVALKESQKISTQNIIDALGSKPIVINAPLPSYQPAADSGELRTTDNLVPEEEIPVTPVFEEEASPAFTETEVPALKKKKKKKKKKKNIEDVLPEPAESTTVSLESENGFQLPYEESDAVLPISDFTADEPEDVAEYLPENDETLETGIFTPAEPSADEPFSEEETADATDNDAIENNLSENGDYEPLIPETEDDVPQSENMWLDTAESDNNAWETFTDEAPASIMTDVSDDWGFGSPDKEQPGDEHQTEEDQDDEEGIEGQDWEWEYVEETPSPENVSFHNDNLQPIAAQSSICSGNLFFQKAVSNPAAVSGGEAVSAMPYPHQAIKDSAAENNRTDPYKNSILQD